MQKKEAGEVKVLNPNQSTTSSMSTVVALAQQRQVMLDRRLADSAEIERALEQWRLEHQVPFTNSTSPK